MIHKKRHTWHKEQPSMEEAWTWKLNIINVNMLWYTTTLQLTLYLFVKQILEVFLCCFGFNAQTFLIKAT